MKWQPDKKLIIPLAVGLLFRLIFFFFGAEIYYGTEKFYIGGDTYSFLLPAKNLVEYGTFTMDINNPDAAFSRLPGYSLLLLPFYLILGESDAMFISVAWFQILLDCCNIIFVFHIIRNLFKNNRMAMVGALLYAIYPFAIVWTPIVYAETAGVFVMLLTFYLAVKHHFRNPLLIGLLIAVGFFIRPQLLFLLPALAIASLFFKRASFWKGNLLLISGFLLLYALWPLRNLINHDKLVLFRDISAMRAWQPDVLNFHQFMTGIQVDWEPQMTQLISNGDIEFPSIAYTSKADSLKLIKTVELSRTCSDGFASFMGKVVKDDEDCTADVAALWKELTTTQMKENSLNYFLIVPLKGLKKSIFKLNLISNWKSVNRSSQQVFLTSALFIFRSLLIIVGLISVIVLIRQRKASYLMAIILGYFVVWYCWLCFVTRYLEIRYYLPADVLLLIPASFYLTRLTDKLIAGKQA